MQVTDSQLEMIFRYFDGELSDEEEQQLLQQLPQNAALQQAFDEQVLLHRFIEEDPFGQAANPELEPADSFLSRVTGAPASAKKRSVALPAIHKNYRWWAAAAAVFICLLAGSLYYLHKIHNQPNHPIVQIPMKDTAAVVKLPVKPPSDTVLLQQQVSLKDLYDRYHTVYAPNNPDVPPPATPYSSQYDRQQYADLAAEKESNLEIKGQGDLDEEQLTLAYFRLYKALASIEAAQLPQAEKLLSQLSHTSISDYKITNAANWYLLLVYLKQGDKEKALQMANSVANNKTNPFYKKALAIKNALHK